MKLPQLLETFVLHFGEMGSRWGINRTVGQIYALLYLSDDPMNADQIVEALGFSRSNVAMGLKELSSMNLVMLKHIPSDRKDYFGTHEEILDVVRNVIEGRRQREVEPTLSMLRSIIMEKTSSEIEFNAQIKMKEMHDLIEMLTDWYLVMQKLQNHKVTKLLKLGSKLYNFKRKKETKNHDND